MPAGVDRGPFARWDNAAGQQAAPAQLVHDPSETPERTYLAVPYREKNEAKKYGARWDAAAKSWYAGEGADMSALAQWLPDNIAHEQAPAEQPREEFADFLRQMGFELDADKKLNHPVMDGQSHRAPTQGDAPGEKAGFYIGYMDGRPAGYAENNRTGESGRWKAKGYTLTDEQRASLQAAAAAKKADRQSELQQTHERTAARVQHQLAELTPANDHTPYHQAKGISIKAGAYTDAEKKTLFVPAYDAQGKHWTTQYIREDGTKRFAKNSKKEGCFHIIGGDMAALEAAPAIVIGEGYATATTAVETINQSIVAAFDSGNLEPVATALRERFPDKPILILGDDDQKVLREQGRNPGREKAHAAAAAVDGLAIHPIFASGEQERDPGRFSDFNDLAERSELGRDAANRQIDAGLREATRKFELTRGIEYKHKQQLKHDQQREYTQKRKPRRRQHAG